jgi:hypothetical protein
MKVCTVQTSVSQTVVLQKLLVHTYSRFRHSRSAWQAVTSRRRVSSIENKAPIASEDAPLSKALAGGAEESWEEREKKGIKPGRKVPTYK